MKLDEAANVIVKTPCGVTEEFELNKLVMQGSVFGPIKATTQIGTVGRDCRNYNQGMYPCHLLMTVLAFQNADQILWN